MCVVAITRKINSLDNMYSITGQNITCLKSMLALLKNNEKLDTYLISPAYFLYTGRKGLWIYMYQDEFALVCWHPNKWGQLLVFPMANNHCLKTLETLHEILPIPPNGILVCRVQGLYLDFFDKAHFLKPLSSIGLDWDYPCQIVSAEKISGCKGKKFEKFRNKINKIKRYGDIRECKLDGSSIVNDLLYLVEEWGGLKSEMSVDDSIDFKESALSAIALASNKYLDLEGVAVFVDKRLLGFYTYENLSNSHIIPAITLTPNRGIPGASEYLYYSKSCRIVSSGGDLFNIGGCESLSLRQFRKKLHPISEYNLRTYSFV